MRKGIALAIITAALLMTACGKGGEKTPDSQAPESTAAAQEEKERTEIADIADLAHDVKGEGVLTYDEYRAAELGSEVTIEALREAGIVKNPRDGVKILSGGELTKKLTVKVNAYSASAKEKIEALGGTAEVI